MLLPFLSAYLITPASIQVGERLGPVEWLGVEVEEVTGGGGTSGEWGLGLCGRPLAYLKMCLTKCT